MRARLIFAAAALLLVFALPVSACVTILQQPRPAVVRPAEFLWSPDPIATSVNASAPSAVRYQWYEGERGDTSHPFAGATSADFCPPPATGVRWQCNWGTFVWSVAVWARVEADCGSADTDFTTVKVTWQWPEGTEVRVKPVMGFWRVLGIADFDRDAHLDFLLHAPGSPLVVVWRMYEETVLSTENFLDRLISPPWTPLAVADMDRDGDPDVLLQNKETNLIAVWILDGMHVVSTESFIGFAAPGWKLRAAADFDRDGDADLLLMSERYQAAVWVLDGLTIVSTNNPVSSSSQRVDAVGDVNQDAWPDLLDGVGVLRREVRTWPTKNLATTGEMLKWPWPAFSGFRLTAVADVDGSGKADFLACSACEPGPFGTRLSYFLDPVVVPDPSPGY